MYLDYVKKRYAFITDKIKIRTKPLNGLNKVDCIYEKFFKLDSLFCINVYKKSFEDFYSGFLNEKRALSFLLECISIFFLNLRKWSNY